MDLIQLLDAHPIVGGGILGAFLLVLAGLIHLRWELAKMKETITERVDRLERDIEEHEKAFVTREMFDERMNSLKEYLELKFNNIVDKIENRRP